MRYLVPLALCAGLGLLTGLGLGVTEQWLRPGPGDPLDLALGMGFFGVFAGLFWGRLERRAPETSATRRRLLTHCLVGLFTLGCAGALGAAALSQAFGQSMRVMGFLPPAPDLAKIAAQGFVYGSLPGLALGYLAAVWRTFFRP